MHRIILSILILGSIGFSSLHAQSRPLRIGVGLLGAAYSGDLNSGNGEVFFRFNPGVNMSLQFAGKKFLSPQLNIGFGRFTAQNRLLEIPSGYDLNNFVSTTFFYLDLRLKGKFFPRRRINPYLSAGIGLFNYTPRDDERNPLADNFESRVLGEEYSSVTAALPLSAGIDIHMNPLLSLGLEYTYRFTFSDYLDNIGQLGTKNGNDAVHSFLVTLYFTLGKKGSNPSRPSKSNNSDWKRQLIPKGR